MYEVRFASAADIPAMYEIYRPYADGTTVSFEYGAPPPAAFAARIGALSDAYPVFVCEEAGRVRGFAYAAPAFERRAYCWCAELSVYVDGAYLKRGMGALLEGAVAACLKMLGYRKVYALVTEENAASVAFHRARGYRETAFFPEQGYKMGKWLGVVWLEKGLNPRTCAADFPRAVSALSARERTALLQGGCDGIF